MTKCPQHSGYNGKRRSKNKECVTCQEIYTNYQLNKDKMPNDESLEGAVFAPETDEVGQGDLDLATKLFTEVPKEVTFADEKTVIWHQEKPGAEPTIIEKIESAEELRVVDSLPLTEPSPITDMKTDINFNNVPPQTLKRNEFGLLENTNYVFKDDGRVDYRRLLKPEHLVLNNKKQAQIETKYGKKFDEIDIVEDKVEDCDLLILLAGIRYLADLRGYGSIEYDYKIQDGAAYVNCTVSWLPNYETNGEYKHFSSLSQCHPEMVTNVFKYCTLALAENAAFVRAVRNFLNIPILGREEIISKEQIQENENTVEDKTSPHYVLQAYLDKKKWKYADIQKKMIEKVDENGVRVYPNAENWINIKDMPPVVVGSVLIQLKKAEKNTNDKKN